MKILRNVLLSLLGVAVLSLIIFTGYRMAFAKAKLSRDENNSFYIEYNGQKYYGDSYSTALPDEYLPEPVNSERLTFCEDAKPVSFITYSIYGVGNSTDMFFEPNYGILGPSVGFLYIREGYVFPTVQNSEVSYIELDLSDKEPIIFTDEKTVNEVVAGIKAREDFSKIFSIEEYGVYKLFVHYKNAPVYEYVGAIWDGKYMYLDEYHAWAETDEFWDFVESNANK